MPEPGVLDPAALERVADELARNDECGVGPLSRQEYLADAEALLRASGLLSVVAEQQQEIQRVKEAANAEQRDRGFWAASASRERQKLQAQIADLKERLRLNQAALTEHIRSVSGWEDFDGTPESAVGAVQSIAARVHTLEEALREAAPFIGWRGPCA